jgi:hypothetical protein
MIPYVKGKRIMVKKEIQNFAFPNVAAGSNLAKNKITI